MKRVNLSSNNASLQPEIVTPLKLRVPPAAAVMGFLNLSLLAAAESAKNKELLMEMVPLLALTVVVLKTELLTVIATLSVAS